MQIWTVTPNYRSAVGRRVMSIIAAVAHPLMTLAPLPQDHLRKKRGGRREETRSPHRAPEAIPRVL
jgi:hypothetical protein